MQKKDNSYFENSGGPCFEDSLLQLISQMTANTATLSETFLIGFLKVQLLALQRAAAWLLSKKEPLNSGYDLNKSSAFPEALLLIPFIFPHDFFPSYVNKKTEELGDHGNLPSNSCLK